MQQDLLRYALFSRLSYYDYDITKDDLCMMNTRNAECIEKKTFIDKGDTQVWIFQDDENDELVITFRGSDSMGDLLTNFCIVPSPFPIPDHGNIHLGHKRCYMSVRNDILYHVMEYVKKGGNAKKTISVCGHSLGGACATICALEMALLLNQDINVRCFSYGTMAFGDRKFNKAMEKHVPSFHRVVHSEDFAPFIPMLLYKHHDTPPSHLVRLPNGGNAEKHRGPHSRIMHHIRHHSIEAYVAGIRRDCRRGGASPHAAERRKAKIGRI
jgi:hypothetical protein